MNLVMFPRLVALGLLLALLLSGCGAPSSFVQLGADDTCANVEHLAPDSTEVQAIGAAFLRTWDPARPLGQIEQLYSVDRLGEWVIVEASFTRAEPGIIVLQQVQGDYREVATWGGPITREREVQDYLLAQAPNAPPALLSCFTPRLEHFKQPLRD